MTNDPDHAPPTPTPNTKTPRRAPSKRPAPEAKRRPSQGQKKLKTVAAHKKATPVAPAPAGKPRQQPVKAATSKTGRTKGTKKVSSVKRPQRKKAK